MPFWSGGKLFGQSTADHHIVLTQEQFIKGCALYRAEVIDGITNVLVEFNLLCDTLKALSPNPEKHEQFREAIIKHLKEWVSDKEEWSNTIQSIMRMGIEPVLLNIYENWLYSNFDYLNEYNVLRAQEFIEANYPYKLKMSREFWEEVEYYNLEHGMTIIDIGTGPGHFPFILAMAGLEGNIIMTEIDSSMVHFLDEKAIELPVNQSVLTIVEGEEKETGLGNVIADKIFLRETFHHIKYKQEILNSIKKNLKKGANVYVKEEVKDYVAGKKNNCKKIIYKKQIISEFKKAGYTLEEDKQLGETAILKFSLP